MAFRRQPLLLLLTISVVADLLLFSYVARAPWPEVGKKRPAVAKEKEREVVKRAKKEIPAITEPEGEKALTVEGKKALTTVGKKALTVEGKKALTLEKKQMKINEKLGAGRLKTEAEFAGLLKLLKITTVVFFRPSDVGKEVAEKQSAYQSLMQSLSNAMAEQGIAFLPNKPEAEFMNTKSEFPASSTVVIDVEKERAVKVYKESMYPVIYCQPFWSSTPQEMDRMKFFRKLNTPQR